jgi:hypothetical protein
MVPFLRDKIPGKAYFLQSKAKKSTVQQKNNNKNKQKNQKNF